MLQASLKQKQLFDISAQETSAICKPLFINSAIVSFDLVRIFNDDTCLLTSTKQGILEHFFKKEHPFIPKLDAVTSSSYLPGKFFWLESSSIAPSSWQETIHDLRINFEIDHGIAITENYNDYIDIFYFYTKPDNQNIIYFYLNNRHILEQFLFYFREKSRSLIKKLEKDKIFLPQHMLPIDIIRNSHQGQNKYLPNQLLPKKYFFNECQYITHRELDVLRLLALGYSVKKIALLSNLSPRTVETYLRNAKMRLDVKKTESLIKLVLVNNLVKFEDS